MTIGEPATDLIAGFRVQRALGSRTWEAVQPELGRRVALRRLEPGAEFNAAGWPERPGVVSLFAVVDGPEGTYVATRFVPGARTFAELAAARPARRRRWLAGAEATLTGAVHGRLGPQDILIDADGRVQLTGFGRAAQDATAADDREALAALRPAASAARIVALGAVAIALVTVGLLVALRGDAAARLTPAPPVTAGATAIGSVLGPANVSTVDCEGRAASGSSLPCTVAQGALPGRRLEMPFRGLVRAWAVRGVRGRVALQVITPAGGRFTAYNRSRAVLIDDPDRVTVIRADLSAPRGSRFALEIAPGGAIGIRGGVAGGSTLRFFGPLRAAPARAQARGGRGQELLLRVDVTPR